jgi:hypothetical protein
VMTVDTSGFFAHHASASCARLQPISSATGFSSSTWARKHEKRLGCSKKVT